MKTLFIYLAVLITGNLLSQEPVIVPNSGCDPKGTSTNPDNYQNPPRSPKIKKMGLNSRRINFVYFNARS